MDPEHARKRGHSRAHDLVSSLTQQILLGTFKPGDKLPSENTLVREHGVSRTVVREALSKLQASGLVEPRHGIGTFVMERQAQAGAYKAHRLPYSRDGDLYGKKISTALHSGDNAQEHTFSQ